jgi:hypothetical protein
MADESLCRRCARCCHEKVYYEGRVVLTRIPCPHLDTETKLCTVYDRRHELNVRCLSVEDGLEVGAFPADCPYVQGVEGYRPPVDERIDPSLVREVEAMVIAVGRDED